MNSQTVLYIEDEEDYQMLVQRILGKAGFTVTVADTGQEGLAALQRERPQLLILDINLPDTDGYAICAKLRSDPAYVDLPILMLTVRRRPEEWLKGFSSGADDYVSKPLNPPELLERVKTCLDAKSRPSTATGTAEYHLIQAALAGNRAAFEVLIQQYKERLVASQLASGRSPSDAEDVVSTAFLRAYEKLDQFRGQSSFYTWLHSIAQNESMQMYRTAPTVSLENFKRGGEDKQEAALCLPDTMSDDLSKVQQISELHRVMAAVPQPFRSILEMHLLKEMSYEDIARREGIPVGTVMSRLFKARKLLQTHWDIHQKRLRDALVP